MKWDAEQAKLMRPFASHLPGHGDFSKYPEIVEKAGRIRSTNISARIEFLIRAPKKAVKGRTFFTDCGPVFCTARGIRDLDRGDLPMGPMGQWNTELSPKTPADEMIAVWMGGCTDRLECQRNTLRAGTEMAITKFEIFNLEYNASDARAAPKDWAVLAQEDDPEVSYFRTKLEGLTQPREGSETDAEARAAADVIHYSNALNQMVPLKGEAQNLDIAVAASGNEASGDRYYGEWQDALARPNRLHDSAKLSLARARLDEDLSPEQIAELGQLEQKFVRLERSASKADTTSSAAGKGALQAERSRMRAALEQARGPLSDTGAAIDAKKRDWGVAEETLSHSKSANDLVASLQRRLAQIDAKLAAINTKSDKPRTPKLAKTDVQKELREPASSTPPKASRSPEAYQIRSVRTGRYITWTAENRRVCQRVEATSSPTSNAPNSWSIEPSKERSDAFRVVSSEKRFVLSGDDCGRNTFSVVPRQANNLTQLWLITDIPGKSGVKRIVNASTNAALVSNDKGSGGSPLFFGYVGRAYSDQWWEFSPTE